MTETSNSTSADDELLNRVGQTSLRMMAGVIPNHVVDHLQARLYASPDAYPWDEVVDTILAEPIDGGDLVNKGILAHRNWVLRGDAPGAAAVASVNRPVPRASAPTGRRPKSMSVRGKTFLAAGIVKGGFFVIYTLSVVALLILLRHKFPSCDIYRVLDWLAEVMPSIFGR